MMRAALMHGKRAAGVTFERRRVGLGNLQGLNALQLLRLNVSFLDNIKQSLRTPSKPAPLSNPRTRSTHWQDTLCCHYESLQTAG